MALRSEDLSYQVGPGIVYPFPSAAARARARRLRRTEVARRRLALVATGFVIVATFIMADGPGGQSPASVSGAPHSVVIRSGDTLWEVAERYAPPSVDPRAYVNAIEDLNGLVGAPEVGTKLKLPR